MCRLGSWRGSNCDCGLELECANGRSGDLGCGGVVAATSAVVERAAAISAVVALLDVPCWCWVEVVKCVADYISLVLDHKCSGPGLDHTIRAYFGTCDILSSGICTSTLPDHSHHLAACRHAQSVIQADVGAQGSLGGATTAMLRGRIAWRKSIVELCAIESIALLAGRHSHEGCEERKEGDA